MSRTVWPYLFALRAAELATPSPDQAIAEQQERFFPSSNGTKVIVLRWSSTPSLGFPRQPFQVYRRNGNLLESAAMVPISATPTVVGGVNRYATLPGNDAAYVVFMDVVVTTGSTATLQAIDVNGLEIPNQTVTLTSTGLVEFRCPGIAAITLAGSGTVTSFEAISETAYANLPDWQLIQTVGLPLENNEIGASYDTLPQGFWLNPVTPGFMVNGDEAALARLECMEAFLTSPGAPGVANFPFPGWPEPNADSYINNLRSAGNLLPMIERCLEKSVDTNPAELQSLYSESVTVDGLNQIGAPPASPPGPTSQVNLPVTSVAMLAVSTDTYAAVGLGYGTLDIPPELGTSGISIAITPSPATCSPGGSVQLTATVTGTTNDSVIWSVGSVVGGNTTVGTISATGLYTAPETAPAAGYVLVYATSVVDPAVVQDSTVYIQVTIFVKPTPTAPVTEPAVVTHPVPIYYPPVDQYGDYSYMVTAPFNFPYGVSVTLAALSTGQLPVAEPANLVSALNTVHAPLDRDQPTSASISVTWDASSDSQGYAILVSRATNQSEVLNDPRPANAGGYDIYVALPAVNPDPNAPADQQNSVSFFDTGCALPLAAPAVNNRYVVAAQDIFGQWSGWVETSTSLSPAAVTKPALISAQFIYSANTGSPVSPVVPATLQIDFGWNWQDRSPGQIRFTGQFVPSPATSLDPPYLGGFALSNAGPIGPPVILSFSYAGLNPATVAPTAVIPTITSGQSISGPVAILGQGSPPTPAGNPSLIQYRVQLTGIDLDFSASTELDFLIYATATEEVQPGVWSDVIDQPTSSASPPGPPLVIGKIVRASDPNPPVVGFAPPAISWTALPDASGNARGILEWQVDPSAAGYYVWEATETALLHLLPPGTGTPAPPPGTPYTTRATTLKNLLTNNYDASLSGFARLNNQMIQAASTEIILPASSDTLYAYRISAIGANNVESARSSSVAIFAVPSRNVPAAPRILLRPVSGPGIEVIALPVESSAPPSGYRLFRVRSSALSQGESTMGPAKYLETSPLWKNSTITTLAGSTLSGKSLIDSAAIPSWFPFYYRATAVGVDDTANGVYPGESPYSSTQVGYSMPANAPLLQSFSLALNATRSAALITFITDLPAANISPIGGAFIELLQLDRGSPPGQPKLVQVLAVAPNTIAVGTLTLPAAAPASPSFARSEPDASEHTTIYIIIPYKPADEGELVLRLTDPLGRQSTESF